LLALGALKILDALGRPPALAHARCQPSHVASVTWGRGNANRVSQAETACLIDRARFDACLMDAARRRGVQLVTPALAGRPQKSGSGWLLPITTAVMSVRVRRARMAGWCRP
jgi:hypothetical protein